MIIPNRQLFSVDSGQTQSGLETHQRCCYFPSFLVVKMFSGADKTAHAAASTRQPPLFTSRQRLPVVATSEATTSFLKMDFTWSQTETAHICEVTVIRQQRMPCQTSQRSHRSHTHKQKQKPKNNLTGRPTSTVAESFYCLLD